MTPYIVTFVSFFIFYLAWRKWHELAYPSWKIATKTFPTEWKLILSKEVAYYNALNPAEQKRFERRVQEFLLNRRITGIQTTVTLTDKLLIASSAIIPVFGFKDWKYSNIKEVLLYPSMFNQKYETEGANTRIMGMVGNRNMEGVMILSKQALELGFKNESDKQNTAIHEFVHLIDKSDGTIDGIPQVLMEKQYSIPWIHLIKIEMDKICERKSDINPYGATNEAEFFSVVSEYFFERPKLLEKNHPELYELLTKVFNQDMAAKTLIKRKGEIGRNNSCFCGSGQKFKNCCGKNL